MKTKIPLWINILQVIILAILAFQTYTSYFNLTLLYPELIVDETTRTIMYTLAGRNAVMVVISLLVLFWQKPHFYSFAFLMHFLRDLQDMFISLLIDAPIAIFIVFLSMFVIPEFFAYLKLNTMAKNQEQKLL